MSDPVPVQKKKHGCLFYGCLTVLVLLLVGGVGAFFIVRHLVRQANAFIADSTDTHAVELPKNELSAAELAALRDRWTAFQDALNAHSNAPPISLTGPELDALLMEGSGANPALQTVFM